MPQREKKIYSGNILEIENYPITVPERRQTRRKKQMESLPKQKNLNDKNARKHVVRLINTNFTDMDIVVHLTYSDKYLPKSEEEARKDVTNYLKRVNYHRKKIGLPSLKYIAIVEFKEHDANSKGVRMHHHIVMSNTDRDLVEKLWKKGWVNTKRLQADESGYEALGRYITKDPKGKKRWIPSKNLKPPTVKVNDFRFSRAKVEKMAKTPEDRELFEKLYPGYIFTSCKVEVNEVTGKVSLYIKMRKIRN